MKLHLLAGGSLLALAAAAPAAWAATFTYDGTTLQSFTATTAGTYEIVAFGAQGGNTTPTLIRRQRC